MDRRNLLEKLNSYDPNINFTVEENPDHFLDTSFNHQERNFITRVYEKPDKLQVPTLSSFFLAVISQLLSVHDCDNQLCTHIFLHRSNIWYSYIHLQCFVQFGGTGLFDLFFFNILILSRCTWYLLQWTLKHSYACPSICSLHSLTVMHLAYNTLYVPAQIKKKTITIYNDI